MHNFDLAVIGGGPAGMMAAGRAGELGASVVLIEKNPSLGVKLLITGNGRCNLTNIGADGRSFVKNYERNGSFLFSSLHKFGVKETINFFESRGLTTKTDQENRVFPASDKSRDVLKVLEEYLTEGNVVIKLNQKVKKIKIVNTKIEQIEMFGGKTIKAKKYLIATGGKSYPATGSSGDGYDWLSLLGHTVLPTKAVLTPIDCVENIFKTIEGVSLRNVEIKLLKNNKKVVSSIGDAIFTDKGMSGPIILYLSNYLETDTGYSLSIDFMPKYDEKSLDTLLIKEFEQNANKKIKNVLTAFLADKLIPVFLSRLKIDENLSSIKIDKKTRKQIVAHLKYFKLEVAGSKGFDKAIVTRGGVDVREINPKTCKSKLIDNLYIAGELLDVDGLSGGFNLQICWSTGWVAGNDVLSEI